MKDIVSKSEKIYVTDSVVSGEIYVTHANEKGNSDFSTIAICIGNQTDNKGELAILFRDLHAYSGDMILKWGISQKELGTYADIYRLSRDTFPEYYL